MATVGNKNICNMLSLIGAALNPNWDYEGREWAGKEQEQLATAWVS